MADSEQKVVPVSPTSELLRLYWMIAGNAALVLVAVIITQKPAFTFRDIIFWFVALSLAAARFVDIRYHKGTTSEGERLATLKDWCWYCLCLTIISLALWGGAHLYGMYGMRVVPGSE